MTTKSKSSTRSFVPNNPLARRGYLRMINPQTELVQAFACPCGEMMPPSHEFKHRVTCKYPQAGQGKLITIPNPSLLIIQTNRGSVVIEGLESAEDRAKFGPCPFPLAHPAVVIPSHIGDNLPDKQSESPKPRSQPQTNRKDNDGDLHRGKNDDLL